MGGLVIDCDSHVMEPADLWQKYLEPEFRDRAIRIEKRDGIEHLIIGEQTVLAGVLAGLGGAHLSAQQLFTSLNSYADGCEPASYDPAARIKLLDSWGVDRGVLFPTIGILPFPTKDMALANAYCRAYNRWQTEFAQGANGRAIPIALINWHDRDEAARELAHCIKRGFRGLFVPPEVIDDRRPSDPHYDAIWRQCEDAGIPGCLHVIVRFTAGAGSFGAWHMTRPGSVFTFGLGATGQMIPAMAAMTVDGLFDRFPKLKIVIGHTGEGLPFWLYRLDYMHTASVKAQRYESQKPLKKKLSDYVRENIYVTNSGVAWEPSIMLCHKVLGPDHVLYAMDYPYQFVPEEVNICDALPMSDADKKKFFQTNAEKLFKL